MSTTRSAPSTPAAKRPPRARVASPKTMVAKAAAKPPMNGKGVAHAAKDVVKHQVPSSASLAEEGQKTKARRARKLKLSYSVTETQSQMLAEIKAACERAGLPVKKSALLGLGVGLVQQLSMEDLKAALARSAAKKAPSKSRKRPSTK